ncbi:MAG TPA: glycosyltransferase N-terminal domain-containing protein [Vicinamibacterales bacterium]|nr:glycosyltransferase N-terminal domain-containing protein [Vicinamibacterales bacterium]
MRRFRKWQPEQWRYAAAAYLHAPVTFLRRVVFGRDPYWRRYFWSRWGFVPAPVATAAQGGPVLWIDALSGGEVTQIVTFCRVLRSVLPRWRFVLSTNTRYSYDFATSSLDVDAVLDSPWDCRGPVRRCLRRLKPAAFICIQNLRCPVLVEEAKRHGVTTILVSGLLSKGVDRHPMFERTLARRPFGHLDWIGAWSQEDVKGFIEHGARPDRVMVTGNMKFDLEYLQVPDHARQGLYRELRLAPDEPVLLAASLHPGEEELVASAYLEARREIAALRLLLVPRYQFDTSRMVSHLSERGLTPVLKSSLARKSAVDTPVIVVDTFGELANLYSLASVVFLGGTTYPRQRAGLGQNPVEPLAHGRPVFFGPFMNLWREITDDLEAVWSGVRISTAADLTTAVVRALVDQTLAVRMERKIQEILAAHRDDVGRNVELVRHALSGTTFKPEPRPAMGAIPPSRSSAS